MVDEPAWFPPPEPIPQGPLAHDPVAPEAAAPVPGVPAASPPPPPQWPPPAPPAPRRRYTGFIVGGSILAFLLVAGAVIAVVALTVNALFPPPPVIQGLVQGRPGSAVAVSPIDCPEDCFDTGIIPKTIADGSDLADMGLPLATDAWGDYSSSSVTEAYDGTADVWSADHGSPDSCFFVYYSAPLTDPLNSPPAPSHDTIDFTGTHTDRRGVSYLSQAVRLFDTSQSAVDHMARLQDAIAACDSYTTRVADDAVVSTVTAAPAIPVPDTVATLGWIEDTGVNRFYTFDVQKANLVVRSYLYTDGAVTEADFRALVSDLAARVGELEPVLYPAYVAPSGCERECLTADQAGSLVPTADELVPLGELAPDPANAALAPTGIGALWEDAGLKYRAGDGDPAVCFFTLADAPMGRDAPDYAFLNDPAVPLGSFANGQGTTLTETARVYTAEIFAGRYIGALRSPIKQCAAFSYDDGGGVREVTLTPQPFDTGTPAVTSAGWVETSGDQRRTVVDLLYANVAMRVILEQTPDSAVTDEQFAQYVKTVAARMQALDGGS